MMKSPIEMIEIVVVGLDSLLDRVVFVGGAVTSLYCDDPAAERIRPTQVCMELNGLTRRHRDTGITGKEKQ